MIDNSDLDPDQPLIRHPEFSVSGSGLAFEVIRAPGSPQVLSTQGSAVMAAFAGATTMREFAEGWATKLGGSGRWMAAVDCVRECFEAGILLPADAARPPARPKGFGREQQHISMLNDTVRTQAFIEALRATVGPDDIVLDIGTGTGVLAIAAAQAGAAHVYAVEGSRMAASARAGVAANGLSDRVTVIHGLSTEVVLPTRATVVVGEIIGDDLFDENILDSFADAARRLATPDARFIPRTLAPVVVPLAMPKEALARVMFTQASASRWTHDYGIDFTWLLDPAVRSPGTQFERSPWILREFQCGPATTLPAVVFGNHDLQYEHSAQWPGYVGANAIAVGFVSEMAAGISITTEPSSVDRACSWGVLVWAPLEPELSGPGKVTVTFVNGATSVAFEPAHTSRASTAS